MDSSYELLDFGNGRKLERFAHFVVDRPCPAAELSKHHPEIWRDADAYFKLNATTRAGPQRGVWTARQTWPEDWRVCCEGLTFQLKPSDFGHLGLFPEQSINWRWIAEQVHAMSGSSGAFRVLNLFAHTGGSTLAAASAGAEVTHVDAAANVVKWARRNAAASNLADAPIRWIAEDATKFANRERKRGRRYNAIVLDPPSYGHGPNKEVWRIDHDLPELLAICHELVEGPHLVLLTAHAPGYSSQRLLKLLNEAGLVSSHAKIEEGPLALFSSRDERQLLCGEFARVTVS